MAEALLQQTLPPAMTSTGIPILWLNEPTLEDLMDAVTDGDWEWALTYLEKADMHELNADNQRFILKMAVANRTVKYRSLVVYRSLLTIKFPMDCVDSALAEAIKNCDWDLVPEICEFKTLFCTLPPTPTLIRITELLHPFPRYWCYSENAAFILGIPMNDGRTFGFTDEEARKCVAIFMNYISNIQIRCEALVQVLCEYDLLAEIDLQLKTLPRMRAVETATGMITPAVDIFGKKKGIEAYRLYRFLRLLFRSDFLTQAQSDYVDNCSRFFGERLIQRAKRCARLRSITEGCAEQRLRTRRYAWQRWRTI